MITYLIISVALFITTFLFYLAVMSLRLARDTGTLINAHWSVYGVSYGLLFIGYVLDVLLNWIVLTVAFLELPQEFLSTARVTRHKHHSGGWRQAEAKWFCKNWLTPFDARHCEE